MTVVRMHYNDAQMRAWAQRAPAQAERARRMFLFEAGDVAAITMRQVAHERIDRIGVRYPGSRRRRPRLVPSIRAYPPTATHVDVGPRVAHGGFVNDGTQPHVIVPRRKKALKFQTPGGVRFAKKVHHPGFAGHHFVERTVIRVTPKLQQLALTVYEREVLRG